MQMTVLIADEQSTFSINETQLREAVETVLSGSPYRSGTISIAVVNDPTIHRINRQYLQHDYPTDVLSFVLEDASPYLEGELIISTDTAKSNAEEYAWLAHDELVLYVIHGVLHLVGYQDKQPKEIAEMRAAEARCLQELGIAIPRNKSRWSEFADTTEPPSEVHPS